MYVDRKDFVPEEDKEKAYDDVVIPLQDGSSVSQPSLVAKMLDFAGLDGTGKVLEIGTASGYSAALLSYCAEEVHTIEYNESLADRARSRLEALNHDNVHVHTGDGLEGLVTEQPFKAIIVTAGARELPQTLVRQLAPRGRLVVPISEKDPGKSNLFVVSRADDDSVSQRPIGAVGFVPLVSSNPGGWTQEEVGGIYEQGEADRLQLLEKVASAYEITLDQLRQVTRSKFELSDELSNEKVDQVIMLSVDTQIYTARKHKEIREVIERKE
jgi:protein-L-isoaspartate(D-aspartate) O-methyltransferase